MNKLAQNLNDVWVVLSSEVRRVFSDRAVLLIFFIAPLIYPLIFCYMYGPENVVNLPTAVVDDNPTEATRRYIRKLDATPEMNVVYHANSLDEARRLMCDHKVRAIFYFPRDFSERLADCRTAHIAVFSDMSSFYYYKAALLGGNSVLIDEMHTIELQRYDAAGLTHNDALTQIGPVVTESHTPFNPSGGYGSFFLPALLLMVVHQTLFLGITILCGDATENRYALHLIPPRLRNRSIYRVTLGRSLCYLLIYIPIVLLDLWLIPRWFNLPQIGRLGDVELFLLPMLLGVVFLAMTIGNIFVRQKISPMLCFVFFSVILFFLSGMVWPQTNMPRFWLAFSYLFPSTPGIQGYVRISSMGATLAEVRSQYLALWIQAGFYFITACFSLRFIKNFRHR